MMERVLQKISSAHGAEELLWACKIRIILYEMLSINLVQYTSQRDDRHTGRMRKG